MLEISEIFYDRESKSWGKYKITKKLNERGKTKVQYYEIKFKNTGNVIEVNEKAILEDRVVDIEKQKKQTKKKARVKKQEEKQNKKFFKRYVLNLGENPRLLGLDISTHSTGYSIFINGKLVDYGYIYQPKTKKWDTARINHMYKEIVILMKKWEINVVAMEDIIFKHKVALYVLSKVQGVVANMLYEKNIKYLLLTPIEWKSVFDINENSKWKGSNDREQSKHKTVEKVNRMFKLNLEEEFKDSPKDLSEPCWYDVADAIGVGYVAQIDRIKK